eukprot:TRINITY_DN63219_c0_g1_i1.p1 TRINITY_DN63219_c0_g1~~TRINITY_DN63219_c0_g1_i1.p1  ORF type:complete len:184 (+),score=29.11 TRINITY_DN63219_c0_g1_i1:283-834(+)
MDSSTALPRATGEGEAAACACKPLGSESAKAPGATRRRGSAPFSRLWLKLSSNPFIKSFVEDLHPGTSKRTRENTRLNERLVHASCEHSDARTTTEMSSSSSGSLSARWYTARKRVSFHTKVKVFSHMGEEGEEEAATEHSIRFTSRGVGLSRRLKRSRPSAVDVSAPQSSAGKWLLRASVSL